MAETAKTEPGPAILRFFSHPGVGIAVTLATLISVPLSFYFYFASRELPELTCFVHPAKAAVVRPERTSGLVVHHDGQQLTTDITVAQVAFWNAGKKSIHAGAVLKPLVIRTADGSRILEAHIRKATRDVIGVTLNTARITAGELEVHWTILEQNDGAVVQLVYAGDDSVEIQAESVIECQAEITHLNYGGECLNPLELYSRHRRWCAKAPYLLACAQLTLSIYLAGWLLLRDRKSGWTFLSRWQRMLSCCLLALSLLVIGWVSWTLFTLGGEGPPFEF